MLPMLEAEVRLQRGRGKQEEEESGSGDATMKGRTGTGQGMDEGPTSHLDNGHIRRVGAGAKGDYKRDGVYSGGI